jgi:uncharacterized iron-regulated protein
MTEEQLKAMEAAWEQYFSCTNMWQTYPSEVFTAGWQARDSWQAQKPAQPVDGDLVKVVQVAITEYYRNNEIATGLAGVVASVCLSAAKKAIRGVLMSEVELRLCLEALDRLLEANSRQRRMAAER